MNDERRKLLSKIAYMHYIEDKNQDVISRELNIYRTTISRMLKQAKTEGIIEFRINDFDMEMHHLEMYIKKKFKLDFIRIVQTDGINESQKDQRVAQEAASYLKKIIKNDQIVGVSWGSTLANSISEMEANQNKNAIFVPIAGGPSHIKANHHVNTLVYELANKLGGTSIFINATVIQEIKKTRDAIMNSKYFEELNYYWKQLDVAIVGIGGTLSTKESQWRDLLTKQDYEDLKMRQAIGDCCCQFFDAEGRILYGELYDRTISLCLESLKKVPKSIAIARSKNKAKAILALFRKHYINTLITDKDTAYHILRLDGDPFTLN